MDMRTFWKWIKDVAARGSRTVNEPATFTGCEGLLVPDKPAVPGASRINMSLYPRSRLRANPTLRPPKPRLPSPPKPGL